MLAATVVAAVTAGFAVPQRAGAPQRAAVPHLPVLGHPMTVDPNDVGDPFVLPVPAGVAPPTGLPYMSQGPDAYQSAPWTAADVSSSEKHGWYVLFGTTDWQGNIPTAVSTDLVHWTQAPDALPVLPVWAAPSISMTWAPSARRVGSTWVMYYSTEERSSGLECIGRATATDPAGPYTDRSRSPMLCQRDLGGSIDPSFVTAGATTYLVWKNDGNARHVADGIWVQALSADGLAVTGTAHRLLGATQPWEKGIVEAPAMVAASRGGFWLLYSGGRWNSTGYATGLAWCPTVTGGCRPATAGPFLATGGGVIGPGGLDTFRAHDGRLWAAFTGLVEVPSTWHPGRYYLNRVLDVAPFRSL